MIKKGDKFRCIKTVYMNGNGYEAYFKDKIYKSERDNCITDEVGCEAHSWYEGTDKFKEHFIKEGILNRNSKGQFVAKKDNKSDKKKDKVNSPSHYTNHPSGIECIEITRHYDFCIGNAMKYLWRCGLKDEQGYSSREKEIEDMKKAVWYINDKIKMLENEKISN